MPYTIKACRSDSQNAQDQKDIEDYYRLRKRIYVDKIGPDQDKYYGSYPTEHDSRENTVFLIFKAEYPKDSGKETVFGGRRIVFRSPEAFLPLEGKHTIKEEAKSWVQSVSGMRGKDSLDLPNIIPAIRTEDIQCAEIGAFAIDQTITRVLFNKTQYRNFLNEVYGDTLQAARNSGADIALIEAGVNNGRHQLEWLPSSPYPYRQLKGNVNRFSNPFPEGQESTLLVVDVSGRFKLTGPSGILRANQEKAQLAR